MEAQNREREALSELVAAGEHVGLRALTSADVGERYLSWMNDREVTQFLESRFVRHTIDSLHEYVDEMSARSDVLVLAIVELRDDRHVGNVKIGPVDVRHRTADLGLLIGEKDRWGKGYATEAIRLATRCAFEQLDVRKLTASCYSSNVGSVNAFRRAGWRYEGARPQQFLADDGSSQDQILFGVLQSDLK
jgi:[ribosomal protein S5]-alanine N-acetyltransferase